MKRIGFFFSFILFISACIFVQGQQSQSNSNHIQSGDFGTSPMLNWYGIHSGGLHAILGLAVDQHGCLYSYGSVPQTTEFFGQTVEKGIFLSKQNSKGEIVWLNQFPEVQIEGFSMGEILLIDTISKAVIISGVLKDTLTISDEKVLIPSGDGSYFIAKFDYDGNFLMSMIEDLNYFLLEGSAVDSQGNIIFCGTFDGTAKIGSEVLLSKGNGDALIAKYSSEGEPLWAIGAGGEAVEYVCIPATDENSNIYIAGEFTSENVMIDQTPVDMSNGKGNVLISKISPEGEVMWAKSFAGSTSYNDYIKERSCWPTGIKADSEGNVYIKGSMSDTAYFDNIILTSSSEGYNKFLLKTNPDGDVIWAKILIEYHEGYDGYWYDYCQMDIDPQGNVIFGSQAKDSVDFNGEFMHIPRYGNDLYVASYNPEGNLNWVKALQGADSTYLDIKSLKVFGGDNFFLSAKVGDGYISIDGDDQTSNKWGGFVAMFGEDFSNGVQAYSANQNMQIYPNPSNGLINLSTEFKGSYLINVSNVDGQMVHRESVFGPNAQIDLSYLEEGVYLIRSSKNQTSYTEKLIIKK